MTLFAALLLALLAWGVLAFGGVYPWAYWPLTIGAAGLGLWAIVRTKAWRDPRARGISYAWAGIAAAVAVQAIPLPYDLFVRLSPAADRLLRQIELGYALQPPAAHALSVRPEATLVFLAVFAAFGLLLVGLMRAISYVRLEWLAMQLMAFGLALALFGIIQKIVMPPDSYLVYGFWRPSGIANPFGPFINRNHFAGLMLLLVPLVAGYAAATGAAARKPYARDWHTWITWLATPDASRFVFASFAALVMAAALVFTGSRSGMLSLVVVLAVFALLAAARIRGTQARLLGGLYLIVLAAGAVGWAGLEATSTRFALASTDLQDRVAAWRDTVQIIRDFPWAGTGFGAYGAAMLVYQTANRTSIFIHAHNDYLQVLAEGGVLVAIPVAIAVIVILRGVYRRLRRGEDGSAAGWLRIGAIAGLAGIAAQSLLEFSLQMPGNAAVAVLLLAIALHRPRTPEPGRHAHRV
jgi:O-antigen ligase